MTTYENLKLIAEVLKTIAWPVIILVIFLAFKANIRELINRLAKIEGSVGSWNFKLQAKNQLEETVKEAIILESQGKKQDAEKLISDNTEIVSQVLGLTEADIKYLIDAKDGKTKGRWGKVHLANAGLIELDGGKLTTAGRIIIDRLLRHNNEKGSF